MKTIEPTKEDLQKIEKNDYLRASGNCECSICKQAYKNHFTLVGYKWLEKQIQELVNKGMTSRKAEEFLNDRKNKKKKILLKDVTKEDLCFRIKTYEHIPQEILDNPKTMTSKLLFQPFKQYAFIRGAWRETGKSHWVGDLKTGEFSNEHGKLTNQLVKAFMMLVEKYSQRGNFRNYSYIEDMRGQALLQLSQVALQFDESRSDNPFSFFTTIAHHSFVKILKQEKRMRTIRDDLITFEGMSASFAYQIDDEIKNRDMDTSAFYSEDAALVPDVVVNIDPVDLIEKTAKSKAKTKSKSKKKK